MGKGFRLDNKTGMANSPLMNWQKISIFERVHALYAVASPHSVTIYRGNGMV